MATAPQFAPEGILMPNTAVMKRDQSYPKELYLAPDIEKFYADQLPKNLETIFDSFGKDTKTDPPALGDSHRLHVAPQQVTDWGESFKNYQAVLSGLNESIRDLVRIDANVAPLARKTAAISEQAQLTINEAVGIINFKAGAVPPSGMREDEWVMKFLTEATNGAADALERARMEYQVTGGDTDKLTSDLEKKRTEVEKRNSDVGTPKTGNPGSPGNPYNPQLLPPNSVNGNGPGGPGGIQNPIYPPLNLGGLPGLNGPGTVDDRTDPRRNPTDPVRTDPVRTDPVRTDPVRTDPVRTPTDPTRELPKTVDPSVPPRDVTPPSSLAPLGGAMTPAGGGGGMDMSSMWPMLSMMANQANQRGLAENDRVGRPRDIDENRYGRTPQPVTAPPTTPVTTAPQAPGGVAAPPAGAPPGAQQPGPNPGEGPKQPVVAQGPAHTPDADGNVMYPFPDGKNQLVTALVAQALDAAFNDSNATDARQAYAKTAAKWDTGDKLPEIAPSLLTTGDVCTWTNPDHSAIVRAHGSGDEGVLEIIVDGRLVPIENEMTGGAGSFGEFSGFVRPRGVAPAVPGGKTGAEAGSAPVPGDAVVASI